MMKRIVVLIVWALFCSCEKQNIGIQLFHNEDFPVTLHCKVDSVIHDTLVPYTYPIVVRDSLEFMFTKNKTGYLVEVTNWNNPNDSFGFALKGTEENQFAYVQLTPTLHLGSDLLYLVGGVENSLSEIHIDSLLKYRANYRYDKVYFPSISDAEYSCRYDSNQFVTQHLYHINNKKYSNGVERFLFVKEREYTAMSNRFHDPKKYKYWVANENAVIMCIHHQKKLLWCISKDEDRIDIYSTDDFQLQKTLKGPYHHRLKYKAYDNGITIPNVHSTPYYDAYLSAVTTDEYIYLLFGNRNYDAKGDLIRDGAQSEIYKLDWEGNLLARYLLEGAAYYRLSLDEQEKYFYCAIEKGESYNLIYVRYKIPEYE